MRTRESPFFLPFKVSLGSRKGTVLGEGTKQSHWSNKLDFGGSNVLGHGMDCVSTPQKASLGSVATHASLLKDVQADPEKIRALNEFGTSV